MTGHLAFRGTTLAGALLFDVPTIGVAEARRRVLAAWQPDSTLRALPDGSWLLTLPEPVAVRAEFAPGLPLVKRGDGWSAPGLEAGTASQEGDLILLPRAGNVSSIALTATIEVDTRSWIDLTGLTVHRLTPLDRVPEDPHVPIAAVKLPAPDLRATARLGLPSTDSSNFRRSLTEAKSGRADTPPEIVRFRWVLAGAVLLLVVVAVLIATSDDPAGHLKGLLGGAILIALIRLAFSSSTKSDRGEAAKSAARQAAPRGPGFLRQLWSAVVWRSPAAPFLNRKQQRYLEELTRKFERREFDQALRDAIGLSGSALNGLATLRLPTPRTSLTPGSSQQAGASAFGHFPTAFEQLKELYLQAARELEKAGRIDEAAFVYADLLDDTRAAVDVLERHDRPRLAAELAEGKDLEAALVIRLWWRAGDRDRAVEIARSRGAFAAGIERLHAVAPDLARELRVAWVDYCRQAGDPVAAVDAAWPDAALRPTVFSDIAAGVAMGGPRAAYLFAHLVTERPTAANLDRALALLDSEDAEARQRFVSVLVRLRSTDRMHDKRLATAALRSLLRDGSAGDESVRRAVAVLRDRCDPLVRADLPRLPLRSSAPGLAVTFSLADEPGALPVSDAAALRGDAVLVAHGEHGVRLLTHDGRTRARWDLPVHSLVVADHGGTALLVTKSQSVQTIHRLDLGTRTVRPWTSLPTWNLLPSYDSGTVTVINEDGFSFVDTLSDQPKELWHELDALHGIVAVNRTPQWLSALVTVTYADAIREPQVQLFGWELPSMTLRTRRTLPVEDLGWSQAVLPEQAVIAGEEITSYRRRENPAKRELPGRRLISSGHALGLLAEDERLTIEYDGRDAAIVECPSRPGLRERDGLIALWTQDGRIAVIDPAGPTVLANFRTRL